MPKVAKARTELLKACGDVRRAVCKVAASDMDGTRKADVVAMLHDAVGHAEAAMELLHEPPEPPDVEEERELMGITREWGW